jgi:hypothetical protein
MRELVFHEELNLLSLRTYIRTFPESRIYQKRVNCEGCVSLKTLCPDSFELLCAYGLMKGDLKSQGCTTPHQTVAIEKVCKQTQFAW